MAKFEISLRLVILIIYTMLKNFLKSLEFVKKIGIKSRLGLMYNYDVKINCIFLHWKNKKYEFPGVFSWVNEWNNTENKLFV